MTTQISVILYSSLSPSDPSIVRGIQERKAGTNGDPLTHSGQSKNGHHFAEEISKWIFFNGNYCILIIISMKCIPKGPINTMKALVQMMVRCQTSNHGWWWLGDPRSQSISTSETEGLNSVDGKSPHSAHGCTCMKSYWPPAKRWLEMEASSHGQLSMSVISILIWQMYNSNVTTLSM